MSFASLSLFPALVLAATALPSSSSLGVSSGQDSGLFPAPKGDLTLNVDAADQPTTMIDVLAAYGELTGQTFTYDGDVENALRHTDLNLTRSRTVPTAEVQRWVENLLAQNDFVIQPILRGVEPLTAVHNRDSVRALRDMATPIAVAQLDSVRYSAATMVSTIVHLPNTDVRQLSNAMRTLVTDANVQSLLPAGATNSMHIVGFGPWVAEMADALIQVDASASPVADSAGPGVEMKRYQLQYADAQFAADLVQSLVHSTVQIAGDPNHKRQPTMPLQVLADPRTNALLVTVRADLVDRLEDAVALVDVEAKE